MKKLSNVTLLGVDCLNVERIQKALDISSLGIEFGAVKLLTSLPTDDPRKIEIPHIGSIEEFSRFSLSEFHTYVDTDYVLTVHWDGFVLNPLSWSDEFLAYDYIGAPWLVADWSVRDFNFPPEWLGTWVVGNGGFCIRSKKLMETTARLVAQGKIPQCHPEDTAICVWYRELFESEGITFTPVELAQQFSIEGDDLVYDKQFGFHSLKHTDIQKWIDENPKWSISLIKG
jgi:hypothetical protein